MDDREFGFYIRLLNHSWLNNGVPSDLKRLAVIMAEPLGMSPRLAFDFALFLRAGRKVF